MFYDTIKDVRQHFIRCWAHYQQQLPLSPLERQLIDVILAHPEFHAALETPDQSLVRQYFPELGETNPFFHMGLHLAIREQVNTNRPRGIQAIYQRLIQHQPPLEAEHALMQCLADCLWQAQRAQTTPDERAYLAACQQLGWN